MYIEPNSNIRILKDVPLDKTFDHTIYFRNASAQATYFMGLQKYNLNNYTYQRVKRGYARVGIKADNLYDCNYMMFQNTSYGNKWFYAFITSVEYLNNECSQIEFEIDVMQTWFFDYSLDQCFVEREHSVTDKIGDNIAPESLATGEYVFNEYTPMIENMGDICIIVAIVDVSGESSVVDGKIYDGIYGGATLWVYGVDKFNAINQKLTEYVQKPEAVVGMYVMPKEFLPNGEIPENNKMVNNDKAVNELHLDKAISTNDTLNGYKPKNNKLYTYPYNFYHVDNGGSASLSLRYEFFDSLQPVISIDCNVTQPITVSARPAGYKGTTELNTEIITLTNYPLCSWNVDTYSAWVAQNSVLMASGIGSALGGIAIGGLMGGVGGATSGTLSAISTITNLLTQDYQASIKADMIKGNAQGSLNVSAKKQQFYRGRLSVTSEYAKIIDDYFTRYGYSTKRLKVPNRNSRPHWNYVKTVGCTVTGSIPSDDMRLICSIYDNGITFWKNGSEIGNYSLDNSPQGGE